MQPEKLLIENDIKKVVEEALGSLSERERKVIEMRLYENIFLDDIAKHFDVTRERIRQIECKAFIKFRRFFHWKKLNIKDYLEINNDS